MSAYRMAPPKLVLPVSDRVLNFVMAEIARRGARGQLVVGFSLPTKLWDELILSWQLLKATLPSIQPVTPPDDRFRLWGPQGEILIVREERLLPTEIEVHERVEFLHRL